MTTLIADIRTLTMGADREATDGGMRCYVRKIRQVEVQSCPEESAILTGGERVLVGLAGLYNYFESFAEWVGRGMPLKARPEPMSEHCAGLVLTQTALYDVDDRYNSMREEFYPYYALGTGAKIAMTALYLGCSVSKALAVAHRFDSYTGLEADILTLDKA